MSYTAKIEAVDTFHNLSIDKEVMRVQFTIHNGKKVVSEQSFSFSLGTSEATIEKMIAKAAFNLEEEHKNAVLQAERAKERAVSDKAAKALTGKVVGASSGDRGDTKKKK